MTSNAHRYATTIKESALRHGFMGAGIARAEHMDAEAVRLEQWLKQGYHGEMSYMANHFDMRVDPTKLVPGARSVISLLYNYYPPLPLNPLKGTSIELDQSSPFQGARGSKEEMQMPDTHPNSQLTTHNSQN